MPAVRAVAALLLVLSLPQPGLAEVYTWTDEQGRVHMTDDLSRVPPRFRKQASGSAREEVGRPREWNAVEGSTSPPASARPAAEPSEKAGKPKIHVLHVERAGHSMQVGAELDNQLVVPFVVDTGAMLNTVPQWAIQELDMEIDDDTPGTFLVGISGKPMFVPVVTFRIVRVGSAEVEDVEMAVLATQNVGLLGMPFFNHFKVSTDPIRGRLTLEEIDLDSIEGVYGGQNEAAWRQDFRFVRYMLEQASLYEDEIPSGMTELEEKLEKARNYWERQLDRLELKASRAGVPTAWRE